MNIDSVRWMKEGAIDLLVEAYSSSAITLQIRGVNDNEMIIADMPVTSDRLLTSASFAISAPPRALTVRGASSGIKRGTCFVRVSLRVEGVVMGLLFADYVTDSLAPAFPYGSMRSAVEGPGLIRSITGTDPAANTEISETVPTGARWKIHSIAYTFVTDANVATRTSRLIIDDGATTVFRGAPQTTQAASSTSFYQWGSMGFTGTGSANVFYGGIPCDFILPSGYRITTQTPNIQVGDNYTAPQLLVEEWISP